MKNKIINIYSDGGSRGNPGKAASAFVVYLDGKVFHKESKFIGTQTNNVAEYSAVVMALTWLYKTELKDEILDINFYMDSELIVNQLSGKYKVKNKNLLKYFEVINKFTKQFKLKINFIHVKREKNKLADTLVNQTLDSLVSR